MPGLFARLFGSSKSAKPARVTKPASPRKQSVNAPAPKRASVSSLAPPSSGRLSSPPPGIELDAFGPLRIDQPVIVNGSNGLVIARVRYFGTIDGEGPAQMVGVEYEQAIGKSDGTINGRPYFSCLPNRGDFVMRQFVQGSVEKDPTTAIFLLSKKLTEKDERQKARETLNQSVWSVLDTHRENHVVHARNIYKKLKELREQKKAALAAASGIPDATRPRSRSLPAVQPPPVRPPVTTITNAPTTTTPASITSPPPPSAAATAAAAAAAVNAAITSPVGAPASISSMTIAVSPPTPSHQSSSSISGSVDLTPAEELELLELPASDQLFLETQASVMWDKDELRPFTEPVTLQYVLNLIRHFRDNRLMEVSCLWKLLKCATRVLSESDNIVTLPIFPKITVIGDLHGQIQDLFYIFNHNDLPSEANPYLFNGDFVDRGQNSCEVLLILLALKLLYPKYVYLNRGNHEATTQNVAYGFKEEVCTKYGEESFDYFLECFAQMPIAHIIQGRILVVHGGICITQTLTELRAIPKQLRGYYDPHEPGFPPGYIEMLWNDPQPEEGFKPSERMTGYTWGPDYTRRFCDDNKITYVIRAHELRLDTSQNINGWLLEHDNRMLTVFSASNYGGAAGNHAAFAIVRSPEELPELVTYFADNKEDFSPHRAHRNSVIEEDIIYQLCEAIAGSRQQLLQLFRAIDTNNTGIVTRNQCEGGLQQALNLRLPFMAYSEGLSLGKSRKNEVQYIQWLDRFRPVNSSFTPMHVGPPLATDSQPPSPSHASDGNHTIDGPVAPVSLDLTSSATGSTNPNGTAIVPPSPAGVLRKRLRTRAMIVAWLGTGSTAAQSQPSESPTPATITEKPFAAVNAANKVAAATAPVVPVAVPAPAPAPVPVPVPPASSAASTTAAARPPLVPSASLPTASKGTSLPVLPTPSIPPSSNTPLPSFLPNNILRSQSSPSPSPGPAVIPRPGAVPAPLVPSSTSPSVTSPSTPTTRTEPIAIQFSRGRGDSFTAPSTPPAIIMANASHVPNRPITFPSTPPSITAATAAVSFPIAGVSTSPPPAAAAAVAASPSSALSSSSSASPPSKKVINPGIARQIAATQAISDFLYKHRMTLETYFHHHDIKKNGLITPVDFEHAVVELNHALPNPLTSAQIKDLLISFCLLDEPQRHYEKLFRGFEFADPELRERTRKWKLAPAGVTPASPQVQPGALLNAQPQRPPHHPPAAGHHPPITSHHYVHGGGHAALPRSSAAPPMGRQGSFELGMPPQEVPDPLSHQSTNIPPAVAPGATGGATAVVGVVNLPSALIPRSHSEPTHQSLAYHTAPTNGSAAANGGLFVAPVNLASPPTMFRPISFGTPTAATPNASLSSNGSNVHAIITPAGGVTSNKLLIGTLTPPQMTRTISGNGVTTPPSASSPNLFATTPTSSVMAPMSLARGSSFSPSGAADRSVLKNAVSLSSSPTSLTPTGAAQTPLFPPTTSPGIPSSSSASSFVPTSLGNHGGPPTSLRPIVVTIRRNSSPLIQSPFVRPASANGTKSPPPAAVGNGTNGTNGVTTSTSLPTHLVVSTPPS